MEFTFPVTKIFRDKITKVKNDLLPEGFADPGPLARQCPQYVAQVVDALGAASAGAQGLAHPVTSADRLRNSDHTVYVMVDNSSGSKNGRIVGFLKTGYKNLYLYDKNGHNHETKPLCVLDFFIHDALQRRGLGKELFDHMLRDSDISPKHLALDRPSDTFMAFVRKHYGLFKTIPQVNHYAIYDDFFSKRHDGKSQYLSRLHGRTSLRGGRQPLARRGAPSATGQQNNASQPIRQQQQQQQQQQQSQNQQNRPQQQNQQYLQQHQFPLQQHPMAQPQHEMAQQHVQAHQLPVSQQATQHHQHPHQQVEEHQNQLHPQSDTPQQPPGPELHQHQPPELQHPPAHEQTHAQQQQQPGQLQSADSHPQDEHHQHQYLQQGGAQPVGRLWADTQRSSVGECLTYAQAGSRWASGPPALPFVPRPAAGKASMVPTPNGPVMLVPAEPAPDGQPPATPCAAPATPTPGPLVAGGDGCGVAPPATPGAPPALAPPHPLDKNAAPTAYELMRKSKYSHTPLW